MTISSMGTPGNPLVGGRGTLIRDAIHSRNYVAGVSGWTINSDGYAELNGVVIRGSGVFGTPGGERVEISNTGIVRIYDAANQLVVQLDAAGLVITDPGTGSYAQTTLAAGYTVQALQPPAVVGHVFGPALLYGDSDPTGDAWAKIESPSIDGGDTARILLYGENASIPDGSQLRLNADRISMGGPQGVGRGPVARAFSATDSAGVTAETVMLTATSFDYVDGRAYKATCGPLVSSSNVNGRSAFRIRKTNAAGQQLGYSGVMPMSTAANNACNGEATFYFKNDTGADITAFIALTLQNLDGGANTSQQRVATGVSRYLLIEDCGDVVAYDFATDLV